MSWQSSSIDWKDFDADEYNFRLSHSGTLKINIGSGSDLSKPFDLIASAEDGGMGYDAVQFGASIITPKPPTLMSLSEIFRWIKETPGQAHAIGRYQFILSTLSRLVRTEEIDESRMFTKDVQDLFARRLVLEAGYNDFVAGKLDIQTFMDALAKVWAGLPARNGKPFYHDYAGNFHTISRADYYSTMKSIFDPL